MKKPKWNKHYIKMFVDLAHSIPFFIDHVDLKSAAGKREAYRYLMVCGYIPVNATNVTLGPESFYLGLDSARLQKYYEPNTLKAARDKIEKAAQQIPEADWDVDNEGDEEILETLTSNVDGVWIRKGKIVAVNIIRRERVEVTKTYATPEKLSLSFGDNALEVR
jgi:hypothetical protein